MRGLLRLLLVAELLCSCVFDRSGLSASDRGDVVADAGQREANLASDAEHVGDAFFSQDHCSPTDTAVFPEDASAPDMVSSHDSAARDTARPLDSAPVVTPVASATLSAAFKAAYVPCSNPSSIPIVDRSIELFTANPAISSTLWKTTLDWINNRTTVSIRWDPNACGDESAPYPPSWTSAGLLIRGATLDEAGRLLLAPGTKATDINFINVNDDGSFQDEFAKPDDSELSSYPQWVASVVKAKQLVLQLAGLPY